MGLTQDLPGGYAGGQKPSDGAPVSPSSDNRYGQYKPRTTSAWSSNFHSTGSLRREYYTDASGNVVALQPRLNQWRTSFVQQGDADFSSVLDYSLGGGGGFKAKAQARRGIGDREADVKKFQGGGARTTISGWLEFMRTADADEMVRYQEILLSLGYMDPDVYDKPALLTRGVYDEYTMDAWQHLLKDAVMAGDTRLDETLARRQAAIEANGGLGAFIGAGMGEERAPFSPVLTSAEDIRGMGEQVAKSMTGRRQEGFADSLVSGYQGLEESTQRAEYDADDSGGATVAAPSTQGYAEDQLRQRASTEVGAYAGLGAFNVILQDLGMAG